MIMSPPSPQVENLLFSASTLARLDVFERVSVRLVAATLAKWQPL